MSLSVEQLVTYAEDSDAYNAFCSIEEADHFHSRRLANVAWKSEAPENRKIALFNATDILNRESWLGQQTKETQNLVFPRMYVPKQNKGHYFSEKSIPDFLKYATAELANYLLLINNRGDDDLSKYQDKTSEIKLGKLTIKKSKSDEKQYRLPSSVFDIISRFTTNIGSQGGNYVHSVKLG